MWIGMYGRWKLVPKPLPIRQWPVHTNPSLTNIERFHYLRSLLTGSAASALPGLIATGNSYLDAVEILKRRFGDTYGIELEHMNKLRTVEKVTSSDDVKGLRRLHDYVQTHIRGLRSLDVSPASYASMMCEILIKTLPQDLVLEYHRRRNSVEIMEQVTAEEKLKQILSFLSVEVESRERIGWNHNAPTTTSHLTRNYPRQEDIPSAAALQNNVAAPDCFFCHSRKHRTEDCLTDITVTQKKERLAADSRCFQCTMKGHCARDCRQRLY